MQLVMFDIDGTLANTVQADGDAYVQAVRDVFGWEQVSADWTTYAHVTDSGVIEELCTRHRQHPPTAAELDAFQRRCEERFALAMEQWGNTPIGGAATIIPALIERGFAVAIATGSWRRTARLKLRAAGIPTDDIPAAHADDGVTRVDIMRCSAQRAAQHWGRECKHIVYIGDGVWDVRASRALGYGFIGRGEGEQAELLKRESGSPVFADYHNTEQWIEAILRSVAV